MSADYRQHKDSIVNKGNVYLIPLPITQLDEFKTDSHPLQNTQIINQLNCFAVENVRTARRFLKKINRNIDIDQLHFIELNKKTTCLALNLFCPWLVVLLLEWSNKNLLRYH